MPCCTNVLVQSLPLKMTGLLLTLAHMVDTGTLPFAGRRSHHLQQNGGAHFAKNEDYAPNDDDASAAAEGVTEDEHADSASEPQGPYQDAMPVTLQNVHSAQNQYASTEQHSYVADHEDTASEGTR